MVREKFLGLIKRVQLSKKSKKVSANAAMLAHTTPDASHVHQVEASVYAMIGALNQMTATGLELLALFLQKLTGTQIKYIAKKKGTISSLFNHIKIQISTRRK
ncbi:hypothetical protein NPIL_354141 [Nephila pilipes]|uniref:Uncharacterized protein n=1 Tax=Nephila pilipes TaxID=299642 RepID=A0A8X6U9Y7_NEPPI|nr:hypothetical protein NPIL_354141 [Nephila pilipes]